jgi:hypothetical protein
VSGNGARREQSEDEMKKYVVVVGRSILGAWRGVVERKPGETDAELLADTDAVEIVASYDTENEAAQNVDRWATPFLDRKAAE